MVPKKSLFFAGATLLCMSSAFAQSAQSKKIARVSNKVMHTASLDLSTGVITRGPNVQQKAAGPTATAVSVNNLDFGGFIGIDSGLGSANGPCEWISSVVKDGTNNSGGQSTYMTSYLFAYCSIAKDVNSGGPGATATMIFWDGFQNGTGLTAGSLGTGLFGFTVTGLPGNTGLTSFTTNGFQNCVAFLFNIGVTGALGTNVPVVVPDSSTIAVSFRFDDLASDGTLAATATFLSCVASCSGVGLDSDGMVDLIDNYCAGTFLTSFSFFTAGFGFSFSSVSFSIRELCPIDASDNAIANNGAGGNTPVLAAPMGPALGSPFSMQTSNLDNTGLNILIISAVPTAGLVLGGSLGELLINSAAKITPNTFGSATAGGVSNYALAGGFPLPLNLNFFGFSIHAQSVGLGVVTGTVLSNRLDMVVGSQL